jgi:high-affinity Fe2+/Pb2+ permease
MFFPIDRFVLSKTESLAHFLQRNFAVQNSTIINTGCIITLTCIFAGWFLLGVPNLTSFSLFSDLIIALGLIYYVFFLSHKQQAEAEQRALRRISNPLKISLIFIIVRLCHLYLVTVTLIIIVTGDLNTFRLINLFHTLGFSIFLYFMSVDTLPPQGSKASNWLNKTA